MKVFGGKFMGFGGWIPPDIDKIDILGK